MLALTNPAWSADGIEMIIIAMFRVLLQSRPDAPNDMMLQIPNTCSLLLPVLVSQYVCSIRKCDYPIDSRSVTGWICRQKRNASFIAVYSSQSHQDIHSTSSYCRM